MRYKYKVFNEEMNREDKEVMLVVVRLINVLTNRFKWFVFYFFIYEAEKIRIKMISDTPAERNLRLKIHTF